MQRNQRRINVKNAKKIRDLLDIIEDLENKLEKVNNNYKRDMDKYSRLGKNEENIRKKVRNYFFGINLLKKLTVTSLVSDRQVT